MTIRSILVTMHAEVEPAPQLDAALQIARQFGGTIDAFYVRPDAAAELATMSDAALTFGVSYQFLEEAGVKRAARARESYEAWSAAQAKPAPAAGWSEHEGLLEAVLVHQGRLADLIVLRHPERDVPDTERAFDAAVFGSARPCLVVRDAMRGSLLDHVMVAWNGSLEGARAMAAAMPLLEAADRVSVFSSAPMDDDAGHGPELARSLARHGIEAHLAPATHASLSVGALFLQAAEESGATMLVMGAYTHSRVRQILLGGVTRHVLENAKMPVLMAH